MRLVAFKLRKYSLSVQCFSFTTRINRYKIVLFPGSSRNSRIIVKLMISWRIRQTFQPIKIQINIFNYYEVLRGEEISACFRKARKCFHVYESIENLVTTTSASLPEDLLPARIVPHLAVHPNNLTLTSHCVDNIKKKLQTSSKSV